MTEIADAARGLPDAKVRRLLDWIRENMLDGRTLERPLRILIFTEYDDTKRYLREQLSPRSRTPSAPTSGSTSSTVRRRRRSARRSSGLQRPPESNPLRILIATDAAREGVNLQAHCWHLFHFDVPWNPSRWSSATAASTASSSPATEVCCHYFVYLQRPEDRVLEVLVERPRLSQGAGEPAQVVESRLERDSRRGHPSLQKSKP